MRLSFLTDCDDDNKKQSSTIEAMNELTIEISELFINAGIANFEKLPDDIEACGKFAKLFNTFNQYLEAAKI
ncbi:hypothetical protein AB6G31_14860 [Providencia hangzhouensis]|uniref:hypothetical protein n=1 Tax=Providencia hangzhouensis TaxID=3031799 RepID=UPI0034DDA998